MKDVLSIFLFMLFTVCGFAQSSAHSKSQIHKVIVKKVLQTTSYTYLYVSQEGQDIWLAVPSIDAKKNDVYYYGGGMEMRDFKSTELDTVFRSVWFVQGVYDESTISSSTHSVTDKHQGSASKPTKLQEKISPAHGGVTISELINNRERYEGKEVIIKGRVTKFSTKIMGTNWIHLNDGSGENSDITVTSNEHFRVGDIIVIKGKVVIDKDFGYGYFYKVLIEKGTIVK